ncbi:hypothetical protein, partial [Pseudomonas sp. KCJK9000]
MKLNKMQQESITKLAASGREAWLKGDIETAEINFLASWEAIPEPKLTYDISQTASYGITVFYRSIGKIEKAKAWLRITKEAYGTGEASEEYTNFL